VANDGAPIPAAEVDHLFDPFRRLGTDRTAPRDGHHGLGLSIVAAIATAHGATLTATARPEGGLAVEVRFPPRGDGDGAPERSLPVPAGGASGTLR
jgi:signal transduction histidine kinase